MKLVETDRDGPPAGDVAAEVKVPPRPERRRVAVSLLLTASVLIGTVVAVYAIFPERHNLLMSRAAQAHRHPPRFQLEQPSPAELAAWSLALLDRSVPWPEPRARVRIVGAAALSVLNRPAALVRYRAAGTEISLVVQRARQVPPRRHRRVDGQDLVVSWREGPWTFVVVGPATEARQWQPLVGAP